MLFDHKDKNQLRLKGDKYHPRKNNAAYRYKQRCCYPAASLKSSSINEGIGILLIHPRCISLISCICQYDNCFYPGRAQNTPKMFWGFEITFRVLDSSALLYSLENHIRVPRCLPPLIKFPSFRTKQKSYITFISLRGVFYTNISIYTNFHISGLTN